MTGLFYHKDIAEHTTFSLLRFYENGYVIFKKITGTDKKYLAKELKTFSMNGHIVNGEVEYTFCGAFETFENRISFKVENEIRNPSDSWAQKDVLSFKGTMNSETELILKQTSKRTTFETENKYLKTTDEELLNEL